MTKTQELMNTQGLILTKAPKEETLTEKVLGKAERATAKLGPTCGQLKTLKFREKIAL